MLHKSLIAAFAVLALAGCAGAGAGGGDSASKDPSGRGSTITVLAVNNPQMLDAAKITKRYFTAKTGIKVKFTFLPENDERDKATQDVANGAGEYDVMNLGPYEVPIWAQRKWLEPLAPYIAKDPGFDENDLIPTVRSALSAQGSLYAVPFATESTLTAYRKDLLDAQGLKMPPHPTWDQVRAIAMKVKDPSQGISGICMRGLAGWGMNMAPFTSMLHTFGGSWFSPDWDSQATSAPFKKTFSFYVDLAKRSGQKGAGQISVSECYNDFLAGKTAMWVDSSAAAPYFEDPKESKVAGKVGYAFTPHVDTQYSGWLWSWGWAIPSKAENKNAAWKFLSWIGGKQFNADMGKALGWSHAPGYARESTFKEAGFVQANKKSLPVARASIEHANPNRQAVGPVPYSGIQYLTIPEWPDLGTQAGQQLSAAIGGSESVDKALGDIASDAQKVAKAHR